MGIFGGKPKESPKPQPQVIQQVQQPKQKKQSGGYLTTSTLGGDARSTFLGGVG